MFNSVFAVDGRRLVCDYDTFHNTRDCLNAQATANGILDVTGFEVEELFAYKKRLMSFITKQIKHMINLFPIPSLARTISPGTRMVNAQLKLDKKRKGRVSASSSAFGSSESSCSSSAFGSSSVKSERRSPRLARSPSTDTTCSVAVSEISMSSSFGKFGIADDEAMEEENSCSRSVVPKFSEPPPRATLEETLNSLIFYYPAILYDGIFLFGTEHDGVYRVQIERTSDEMIVTILEQSNVERTDLIYVNKK